MSDSQVYLRFQTKAVIAIFLLGVILLALVVVLI